MNLHLAWRNLVRNYKLTLLVFASLVLGITGSMVLYTKINYELSFDKSHADSRNIYRVVRVTSGLEYLDGGLEYRTGVYFPLPNEIRKTIPEVRNVSAMFYQYGGIVAVSEDDSSEIKEFDFERGIVFTEASFFEIFDFGMKDAIWLEGEGKQVLNNPFVAVLTRETADRLFLDQDPVGREISVNGQYYTIGGIVEDFPQNTDFPFQVILSLSTFSEVLYPGSVGDWGSLADSYQCYVVLNDRKDVETVEQKFRNIYASHTSGNEAEWRRFRLQPLQQVHKESEFGNYNNHTVSSGLILGISLIGIFIYIIACFNYSNFFLAESIRKEKQITVRMIMGGRPFNVFIQFLSESIMVTSAALLIGLVLAYNLLTRFHSFIDIPQGYLPPFTMKVFLFILILLLVGSFLPVIFSLLHIRFKSLFFSFRENEGRSRGSGVLFRKGSVILQFVVAQVVIISTLIIIKQIGFINNKELGYDTQNIMVGQLPEDSQNRLNALSGELLSVPGVEAVSFSSITPAESRSWAGVSATRNGQQQNLDTEIKYVDNSYLDLYSLKLLAGRNFTLADTTSVIVNREFVSESGMSNLHDALGTIVWGAGTRLQIIGIVDDFHSGSLKETIRPCMFYNDPEGFGTFSIKLSSTGFDHAGNQDFLINQITERWQSVFADETFEYGLFADRISDFYRSEHKAFNLFILLACITIFLCILGILGLSLSINERRTKEIGIRKVNGARAVEVMAMLNKNFVDWVAIAFVVATPIAYYTMTKWLQNFAYKTALSWWIFALSGLLALGIALLTVSWQTWKAASRNPVEALRYE